MFLSIYALENGAELPTAIISLRLLIWAWMKNLGGIIENLFVSKPLKELSV